MSLQQPGYTLGAALVSNRARLRRHQQKLQGTAIEVTRIVVVRSDFSMAHNVLAVRTICPKWATRVDLLISEVLLINIGSEALLIQLGIWLP